MADDLPLAAPDTRYFKLEQDKPKVSCIMFLCVIERDPERGGGMIGNHSRARVTLPNRRVRM